MFLNDVMKAKNYSQYRLAKESGIAQATISDICSRKARIEKCSADTLYKIAKTLDVSMESLIEPEIQVQEHRSSFEVFKSNVCHLLKDKGDTDFLIDTLTNDEIRHLYERKWYAESFYLLAMVDYVSRENEIPLCTRYDDIRRQKMKDTIYPLSVVLLDEAMDSEQNREDSLAHAIPEFLRFNIVESEVRNVC